MSLPREEKPVDTPGLPPQIAVSVMGPERPPWSRAPSTGPEISSPVVVSITLALLKLSFDARDFRRDQGPGARANTKSRCPTVHVPCIYELD
jgi:hypothetical protein